MQSNYICGMFKNKHFFLLLTFVSTLTFFSCRKEKLTEDVSQLRFSVEDVLFDTIFTTISSVTKNFKVYNPTNSTIRISRVYLEEAKYYRFNIDGVTGKVATDIEILPNDSAWVFIEVTLDPNNASNPLLVTDKLIFESGGANTSVSVTAYGQDAVFIMPNTHISGLPPLHVFQENTIWTNKKPIVIYGFAVVDEGFSLEIQAGTKIYLHDKAGLWIYQDASIKALGTVENPIIFQGDRLESFYADKAGQWDRIWINEGSIDNVLENVIVKNSTFGIQAEPLPLVENPGNVLAANTLKLKNIEIHNSASIGLMLRNFKVESENLLIHNSGQYAIAVTGAGNYNFIHTTVANYWEDAERKTPSVYVTNAYDNGNAIYTYDSVKVKFTNSIIWGNIEDEIGNDAVNGGVVSLAFTNCLAKTKNLEGSSIFTNSLFNKDPLFKDYVSWDLRLQASSPAINAGIITNTNEDLLGSPRNAAPDLGAYEFTE